jgi:hypothetical protein
MDAQFSLMGNVSRHHQTGTDRCEDPKHSDHDDSNDGRWGSYFIFPPHFGGPGHLTAFGEHLRRNNFLNQLSPEEKNQEVVRLIYFRRLFS